MFGSKKIVKSEKNLGPNVEPKILCSKDFGIQTNFGSRKNFVSKKDFDSKKILGPKQFSMRKRFWASKIYLGHNKLFFLLKMWFKIILGPPKILGPKQLWAPTIFCIKNILGPKKLQGCETIVWSTIKATNRFKEIDKKLVIYLKNGL